jgi:hypothetical protein
MSRAMLGDGLEKKVLASYESENVLILTSRWREARVSRWTAPSELLLLVAFLAVQAGALCHQMLWRLIQSSQQSIVLRLMGAMYWLEMPILRLLLVSILLRRNSAVKSRNACEKRRQQRDRRTSTKGSISAAPVAPRPAATPEGLGRIAAGRLGAPPCARTRRIRPPSDS